MPVRQARKGKDTVSYRPNAHRTENATAISVAPSPPVAEAVAGSNGTLVDSTYIYQVSAVSGNSESVPSEQVSAETSAGSTGSVALTWSAVDGADFYRVYGRTGTIERLESVVGLSYEDSGADSPDGALPTEVGAVELRLPHRGSVTQVDLGTGVGEYVSRYGSNPSV